MHNSTLTYSQDLLTGLFLGFWNKAALPVSVPKGVNLTMRLDVRSNQENENARYWATDSTERFFGIIAQQDYNTTQTIFSELNSVHKNDFPFIAPIIGLPINFTQGSQTLWKFVTLLTANTTKHQLKQQQQRNTHRHTAVLVREAYTLDLIHLIEYAYNKLHAREFGILYQAQENFATKDMAEKALDNLECQLAGDMAVDESNVVSAFESMRNEGVDALIIAHKGSTIKRLLTSSHFRKEQAIPVLVCTLDLDEVLDAVAEQKSGSYKNVYVATGLPTFAEDNHPLIINFNKAFQHNKRKTQPTYAMLEGFLYSRFFLGGLPPHTRTHCHHIWVFHHACERGADSVRKNS